MRKLSFAAAAAFVLLAPPVFGFGAAHADEWTDWYNAFCSDNGELARWLAGIFGTTAAASMLANFRSKLPPVVVQMLDMLALNFVASLKASAHAAADTVKKGTPALLAALMMAAALSACAGTVTNADGTVTKVPPMVFAYQVACGAYSQAKAPLQVAVDMGAIDEAGQKVLAETEAGADQLCAMPTPPTEINAAITMINRAAAAMLIVVAQSTGRMPGAPK